MLSISLIFRILFKFVFAYIKTYEVFFIQLLVLLLRILYFVISSYRSSLNNKFYVSMLESFYSVLCFLRCSNPYAYS